MFIAKAHDGSRIRPCKMVSASCPTCAYPVIAKMGKVKVHHWAHKEKSGCTHGRGMTEWHYRWIERHFEKQGWDVEYVDGNRRYDCFNEEKGLVLEIQKVPLYDYIMEKTELVIKKGLKINWIFHSAVLDSFRKTESHFEAYTRHRLVILDILEWFADVSEVQFYIDTSAWRSNGRSSKGLLKLLPTSKSSNTYNYYGYYRIRYVHHEKT